MKKKHAYRAFVIGVLALLLAACQKKPEDYCLAGLYKPDASAEKRRAVLDRYLAPGAPSACPSTYAALLEKAGEQEFAVFREAFAARASCASILALVERILLNAEAELAGMDRIGQRRKANALLEGDQEKFVLFAQALDRKLLEQLMSAEDRLGGENAIKNAVALNAKCIAGKARSLSANMVLRDVVYAQVLNMFLMRIGESGFEAILSLGLESQETKNYVQFSLEIFDGLAVYPLLKAYEQGNKDAGAFIFLLPDTEPVYGRVIDAVNHGRFFPKAIPNTMTSVDELMRAVDGWWGPLIQGKYKGNRRFARYCATHMPARPDAPFIYLFIGADAEMAFDRLMKLRLRDLPVDILQTVAFLLFEPEASSLTDEKRQRYFDQVFLATQPGQMAQHGEGGVPDMTAQGALLFKVEKLPLEYQERFFIEHFRALTPKDREIALFRIFSLPTSAQQRVIKAILPWCSEKERAFITINARRRL